MKNSKKNQVIAGYQIRAKNEKLRKILRNYGEMSWEDLSVKLEKKNVNYITFDFNFREPWLKDLKLEKETANNLLEHRQEISFLVARN